MNQSSNPVIQVLKVVAYMIIPILTYCAMHYWGFDPNVGYPIIAATLGLLGVSYTPLNQIVSPGNQVTTSVVPTSGNLVTTTQAQPTTIPTP